jgi:predicted membrane protein
VSLLAICTNSLLLVLNYIAANICVNTFLKQRNNYEYFLLTEDTWWSLMMFWFLVSLIVYKLFGILFGTMPILLLWIVNMLINCHCIFTVRRYELVNKKTKGWRPKALMDQRLRVRVSRHQSIAEDRRLMSHGKRPVVGVPRQCWFRP